MLLLWDRDLPIRSSSMAKPHNIAHILPWPSIGGTELATLRIAEAVESDEFHNIAFCQADADPVREIFESAGFELAGYRGVAPSYRHSPPFLRNSYSLAREFKRREISLVHCSDLLAAYYAAVAGKLARIPVLCHIRSSFPAISLRDRSFLTFVDRFAFVSKDAWKKFGYKVSPREGVVVYDGLRVADGSLDESRESVRREFDIPPHVKLVGMVARVAPAKDYITLARAAARVVATESRVRFLIVGDHSGAETYRAHYEEVKVALAEHGVTPYFIFTDFRADVPRLLQALDIFVLCTHIEGLPLVILEAMAYAKPVVATAIGGVPEIVVDGKTGLLHAHQDDAQLAAHLLSLLQDPVRAKTLGEAGRRMMQTNFTNEQFAANMSNLYRELLGIARSPENNYGSELHAEAI